jgi:hypothetical protein
MLRNPSNFPTTKILTKSSVADPVFYPSRILDPTTATKGKGEKICPIFSCSPKYYKIVNYFVFELVQKKK